jgi:hypothetical protein
MPGGRRYFTMTARLGSRCHLPHDDGAAWANAAAYFTTTVRLALVTTPVHTAR